MMKVIFSHFRLPIPPTPLGIIAFLFTDIINGVDYKLIYNKFDFSQ